MSALQTAGPIALSATQQLASAHANANSKDDSDESSKDTGDEDKTMKCDQLVRHPPGIEEIRRTPDLNIETREIRLMRAGESYQWEPYRSHGSSPEGWRKQSRLDGLHFNPPLQYLLPDKKPRYVVYAIAVPESIEDSEQTISVADEFGAKVGTFEWKDVHYNYTVSKTLPCFPEPDEK